MPPDASRPVKLSLIVYSGTFDKVHYALATAAAAIAIDTPVTLLFTMDAIACLTRTTDGTPGWQAVTADDGRRGTIVDAEFDTRGVGTFEELLQASSTSAPTSWCVTWASAPKISSARPYVTTWLLLKAAS